MDNAQVLMEEIGPDAGNDNFVRNLPYRAPMGYGGVVADAARPATKPTYDYDIDAHMADWQSLNRAIHQLGLLLLVALTGFAAGLALGAWLL